MINVRQMEQLGGAMGLTETLNDNLTSSSDSNNIDVHMQKNTEYGALAILSASSYGNPNKVEDGETTTGNATGVVMNLNGEWVAGGATLSSAKNYYNAVQRYKNIYEGTYVAKSGDAIQETYEWHNASIAAKWAGDLFEYYAGIVRSWEGSIFSYSAYTVNTGPSGMQGIAMYSNKHYTRAVVVSGQGL